MGLPTPACQTPATEAAQSHREPLVRTLGENRTNPLESEALKHFAISDGSSVSLCPCPGALVCGAPLRELITVCFVY